jgi:glycosyltransferase involved in cell wall biosynthesis
VESSADQIVCISNAVQKFTFDSFESRIFSKYVVVPYTWIPKDFFEKDPLNAVQNSKALKGTRYNLICVSRLVKQKNLKTLIRAVSLLSPSINLEIFGSGPLKLELENLISELKLSKRVFLMGHVPDVESRLRNYQLFILASNYEGFGLSVMEAVVQGIPVVLAKNPALLEIMGENYPFFFEPNDVLEMSEIITKAVNSPRSLVEPFFKRVIREYGPERLMNSMENVYTKALGRKIYE